MPSTAVKPGVRAVLFDLDGTLVDSAPDLAAAANALRQAHGLAPLPFEVLRPLVGTGARGMVGAAFGLAPGEPGFDVLREDFLAAYALRLLDQASVFDGVPQVLAGLARAGLRWGIVTNKATRFSEPLVAGVPGLVNAQVLISGDTTPHAKPHPEPLLEAARRLGLPPQACVYVGDDHRDILAGRAAGMSTLAAAWGYLGVGEAIADWGADAVLQRPEHLLNWLNLA